MLPLAIMMVLSIGCYLLHAKSPNARVGFGKLWGHLYTHG